MSTKLVFEKSAKIQMLYVPLRGHTTFVLSTPALTCDYYWQNHDILQWCKQSKHFHRITGNKYYALLCHEEVT